jgi:hypothetical protein
MDRELAVSRDEAAALLAGPRGNLYALRQRAEEVFRSLRQKDGVSWQTVDRDRNARFAQAARAAGAGDEVGAAVLYLQARREWQAMLAGEIAAPQAHLDRLEPPPSAFTPVNHSRHLAALAARGVTLRLADGPERPGIVVSPASLLNDTDRHWLRQYAAEIAALLSDSEVF